MKQITDFQSMKVNGEKIAMVTAYDFPQAKMAENAGVDIILVGDSLGMVVLGYDSTIPVTIDDMVHHTKAVRRGATNTFTVTDLPFMTYHLGREEALKAAATLLQKGGAHAVKVEGGGEVVQTIEHLTAAGVPVMAHLGLTPQTVGVLGGYKVQGKTAAAAEKLLEDAKSCEAAGAFAIVLECIPKQLAEMVSKEINIPTIGIGAGKDTDGQVLVLHDLISFGVERVPKFVKQFGNTDRLIKEAILQYIQEVRSETFPGEEHTFTMKEDELTALYGGK